MHRYFSIATPPSGLSTPSGGLPTLPPCSCRCPSCAVAHTPERCWRPNTPGPYQMYPPGRQIARVASLGGFSTSRPTRPLTARRIGSPALPLRLHYPGQIGACRGCEGHSYARPRDFYVARVFIQSRPRKIIRNARVYARWGEVGPQKKWGGGTPKPSPPRYSFYSQSHLTIYWLDGDGCSAWPTFVLPVMP